MAEWRNGRMASFSPLGRCHCQVIAMPHPTPELTAGIAALPPQLMAVMPQLEQALAAPHPSPIPNRGGGMGKRIPPGDDEEGAVEALEASWKLLGAMLRHTPQLLVPTVEFGALCRHALSEGGS